MILPLLRDDFHISTLFVSFIILSCIVSILLFSLRACAPSLFIHRIPSQFLGIPLWTIDRDQRGTHGSGIETADPELRASPCPSRTADPINVKSSDGFLEEPIEAAQTTILILGERLIVTSLLFFSHDTQNLGMDRYNPSDRKLLHQKERSWPGSLSPLYMDISSSLSYSLLKSKDYLS